MDHAGNNRYELLFMDDDVSDPLDNIVAKNKKQVRAAAGGGGATAGGATAPSSARATSNKQNVDGGAAAKAKKSNQAEKENKPVGAGSNNNNKVDGGNKKPGGPNADKFKQQGGAAGGQGANANRKRIGGPNNETREGGAGQGQNQRNVNFRQQNGEIRERNNNNNTNRRFPRENGFNNGGDSGTQQNRQLRDRDNRNGPPRYNRNYENGGGNRSGKREFDRQSGSDKTGIKAVEKRDGAGAHNWGSVKETIDDVNKTDAEGGNAEKAEDSGSDPVDAAPVEEETKELTLDEWKAQKQQRVKPTFNIRKAGEGEDTSQWKKMVALNNTKKKENESEEELEFDPAMYPQRVGRQQRVLDIQFNFNDGRRGGGFGGRGRGRGPRPGGAAGPGGPAGGDRPAGGQGFYQSGRPNVGGNLPPRGGAGGKRNFGGDKQQNAAPKVNDERQFPTLA